MLLQIYCIVFNFVLPSAILAGALLRYNLFSFVYLLLWLLGALVPRAKKSSPSSIAIVNWHRAAIILAAMFLSSQIAFQGFLLARMQTFWKNYTYGQDFPNCIVSN